jgi:uncharacterized protein
VNLLIDIGHPAHVHLYKNLYTNLVGDGHKVIVTVKNISSAKRLLDIYNIKYIEIGRKWDSLILKGISQILYNYEMIRIIYRYKILIGIGSSVNLAHSSMFTKMKSILLDDDDDGVEPLFVKFAHPFCDYLLSPDVLKGKRRKVDTIFYAGYHELFYLHPNNFTPDENVLSELGLSKDDSFYILRFNAFRAHHDVGKSGLTLHQKMIIVDILKPYGKIFITVEREIEPELEKYQLSVSPVKIHSLLYYATLFVGDSQTMASEAAVLGTPSIRCNDFVGKISYLEEEEHRYMLTLGYTPAQFKNMINTIIELLKNPQIKQIWSKRRQKMLNEKMDGTSFLRSFIEDMQTHRDHQDGSIDIKRLA